MEDIGIMEKTVKSPIQRAIETVEALPLEDQITLIEIVQHRLVELRRAEISRNADETLKSVREGRARYGSVRDLKNDLGIR